jgi:AmmeMemoRadiSam system protein B
VTPLRPGSIRPAAVAGRFYPAEPGALREEVERDLGAVATRPSSAWPKAVIAPHAGYVYSGPIAASAYALLRDAPYGRVVLVGPAHRVPLRGLAASSADAFETPLGLVRLDREGNAAALACPQVRCLDAAHAEEHSLEVQLPFLQCVLGDFELVPLATGEATAGEVADVLDLLAGEDTLVVISSDLSHYNDYATARRLDRETTHAIEALDHAALGWESACGRVGISGMLLRARRHGLRVQTLDLRNSGDTAGPRDHVVGYGAWAFW